MKKPARRRIAQQLAAALFALLFAFPLLAEESLFVPGDSHIDENRILDRMERELGITSPAPIEGADPQQQSRTAPPPPPTLAVIKARIRLHNGELREGQIRLPGPDLELRSVESNESTLIAVSQIERIEFLDWAPAGDLRAEDGNRTMFFPTQCRALLRDGRVVEGQINPYAWLRLRFHDNNGALALYTYWSAPQAAVTATAGALSSSASAATQPPPLIVREITLIHEEQPESPAQ